MKNLKTLLTLISLFGLGASANAVSLPYTHYVDADLVNLDLNANRPEVSGTWNILTDDFDGIAADRFGFDKTTESISNVCALFTFFEESPLGGLNVNRVYLNLNGTDLLGGPVPVNPSLVLTSAYFGSVYADILLELQENGVLDWSVRLEDPEASVRLWGASLGVEVEAKHVPDSGATFGLLGLAMFGVLAVARRKA